MDGPSDIDAVLALAPELPVWCMMETPRGILHAGEMKYRGTPSECVQRYQAGNLEQAYMRCISE